MKKGPNGPLYFIRTLNGNKLQSTHTRGRSEPGKNAHLRATVACGEASPDATLTHIIDESKCLLLKEGSETIQALFKRPPLQTPVTHFQK